MSTSSSARGRQFRPADWFGAALLLAAVAMLPPCFGAVAAAAASYDATHKDDQDHPDAVGGAAAIHPATQIGAPASRGGETDLWARRGIK